MTAELGLDSAGPHSGIAAPQRRVGMASLLAYSLGAMAYGIKDNGFQVFLLIFYNQVLGLPAVSVGAVIMLALLVDALVDPWIGALSDRTRSHWGRRHPWMLASALPIALAWLALWNPPRHAGHGQLLLWAFGWAVLVRSAMSCYEVPSMALVPELTADYDERTRILAYRYAFGWFGGLGMMVLAYAVFFATGHDGRPGLLQPAAYAHYAASGALIMVLVIVISAVGTGREIARLPRPGISTGNRASILQEIIAACRNRALMTVLAAGLCAYSVLGLSFSLSNYFYSLVWHFSATAYLWMAAVLLAGVLLAMLLTPPLARRMGKRRAASASLLAGSIWLGLPYLLRHLGLFPQPGQAAMLPCLFGLMIASIACSIASFILGSSMLADVVEQAERESGRRSEGLFSAGAFLVQKATAGIGVFLAGLLLSLAHIPEGASPTHTSPAAVNHLIWLYCATALSLSWLAAVLYWRFPFDRAEHQARVHALQSLPRRDD